MSREIEQLINQFEEEFSKKRSNHSSRLSCSEWLQLHALAKEDKYYPDPVLLAWQAGYMAGKKAR